MKQIHIRRFLSLLLAALTLWAAAVTAGSDSAAAALQQLRQRLAARAEHAGVAECLAAARHGDGLVQALAARVLRVAGRVDGLARAAEMVDGVDMIDIERTKIDNLHSGCFLSRWFFFYCACNRGGSQGFFVPE